MASYNFQFQKHEMTSCQISHVPQFPHQIHRPSIHIILQYNFPVSLCSWRLPLTLMPRQEENSDTTKKPSLSFCLCTLNNYAFFYLN